MIAPFYIKNDPEGACEKLVKEAVAAWKKEDEVIDDITIIIVFLNKWEIQIGSIIWKDTWNMCYCLYFLK